MLRIAYNITNEKATSLTNLFGEEKPGNVDSESPQAKIASQIKENKDVELYIINHY